MKNIYILIVLILAILRTEAQTFTPDTKGELQISNSGTATYKVPIALPPGIKEVAPQLAITYNGASVQGLAGMGWNLVGISSISRISSRIDIDGVLDPVDFDNLDRFALDGQRLIEKNGLYGASGTTYQTENYTNLKIETSGTFWHKSLEDCIYSNCTVPNSVKNTAPESFTVTFVDGSKAYYGNTTDSRGLMNWMINRWIDPQGNYIDYTYEIENNTQRIKTISWGNNTNVASGYENKIVFEYKNKLRSEYSYLNYNNTKIEVNKILSEVNVFTGGELFRKYILEHETVSGNYERIKSITESNGASESANPIVFDYDNTEDGFAPIIKYDGVTDSDLVNVKLSGDFDGNGEQDFVTDNYLYLNPIDNGSNWTGIPFSLGTKYFTANTVKGNKLNQFQSIIKVEESPNSIRFNAFDISSDNANIQLSNTKSLTFDNLGIVFGSQNGYYLKTSNIYLEGDFNGDGISEILIKKTIDEKKEYIRICRTYGQYGTDCREEVKEITNKGFQYFIANLEISTSNSDPIKLPIESSSLSKDYIIDFNGDGKSDLLIINENKTYAVIGFEQLTADSQTTIEVLSIGELGFPEYEPNKQIVFGDFNGDSKTDIMIPEADSSSNWTLYQSTGKSFERILYPDFELYQPSWKGAASKHRLRFREYKSADLDKDGKSDFIVNEYETWCVADIVSNWETCNRNGQGYLYFRRNIGSNNAKPGFAERMTTSVYTYDGDFDNSPPVYLLTGNYKNHSAYNNFVFVQGKQVWKGNYNKDLSREATLVKVTEAGGEIEQEISYKKLLPSNDLGNANDIYYSSNSETYPYAELVKVPTMNVVDRLTATAKNLNNQVKIQDFKYFGLVTHSQGLGVLGFKKVARSSWYNDQDSNKIWSIAVTNPQLNGAVVREFTSKTHSISNANIEGTDNPQPKELTLNAPVNGVYTATAANSIVLKPGFTATDNSGHFNTIFLQSVAKKDNATTNDYLVRKDYHYAKVDKANKVSALRITKTSTKDLITGTYSENSFEYDDFENITKNISNDGITTTTVQNTYLNNATATDKNYCIGKLIQKNESVSAYNDTFTSEEKYIYDTTSPNLVKQTQKKGHNTDYINTDYVYDAFGNVTQKNISASGVTSRKVTDTYDANGRFVIKKTDNEGYETTFEYNKLGQQTASKNYLGVETKSVFDNWGKLITNTITGASATAQIQNFEYQRFSGGYYVTTTSNTPGDFSRVFYDVFGQVFKTTNRGLAEGSFISKYVVYDFLGRKFLETEPYLDVNPTSSEYDSSAKMSSVIFYDYLNRPFEQWLNTNKVIKISYNGLSSTTVDDNKTIKTTTDASGNKIEQVTNGETLKYTYYASGNLKETIYGNHKITLKYDGWGRQIYMQDPSVSKTAYTKTYNNFGELLTEVTPTGTITYDYSPTGKLIKKTGTGQNTNQTSDYKYDTKGFIISETGTINGKTFVYNYTYYPNYKIHTITERTPNNFTHRKTFSYDTYGRTLKENTYSYLTNNSSVNNGNNTIEYGYNSYNGMIDQFKDASNNAVLWKLNTVNEKMQALTATFGNGMQITNTYDTYGYFDTVKHATTTTTALNAEYKFNAIKGTLEYRKNNIASVLSWNESFTYDTQDRLRSWTDPTGTTGTTYENDGRIKANDLVGTYNYETSNRYRKKSATLSNRGNTFYTNRTPQTVVYDMFKNPITITEANRGKVNFEYNPSNSRSKSDVMTEAGTVAKTKYYSGITAVEVIERPNQSLQFITYIAGSPYDASVALQKTYTITGSSYTPSNQEYLYLHRDYQGTILAISGNGGVIKERRQYDPWGLLKKCYKNNVEVNPATFNNVDFELLTDRGYTSHEHFFSVGIIHMNARIYDPILHTFLSPDALISDPSNPQHYNRYAYALNNPLMYVDYDGNEPITATVVVTAMVVGAIIGGSVYVATAFINGSGLTWGGLAKSILVGAVSGAASAGIGSIINSASTAICAAAPTLTQLKINLMLAIPQAAMHGLAQGMIQGVSGGSFEQSFWTAAVSSIAGSGFGMIPGKVGGYAKSPIGQSLFSAVAGGVTSQLQGGNFWEGAAIGLMVGLLNHSGNKLYPAIERMMGKRDPLVRADGSRITNADVNGDGKVALIELEYWYRNGGGKEIYIDASSLSMEGVDPNLFKGMTVGQSKVIDLFFSDFWGEGSLYGKLEFIYQGGNKVSIVPNMYNFDVGANVGHPWFNSVSGFVRNVGTVLGNIVAGSGTEFMINFKGYATLKFNPNR